MMRNLKNSDLVGKTIKKVDTRSVNVVWLTFDDDSTLAIWAEAIHSPVGPIPELMVEDK